jgi:exodeoxyribonuclease V alpha subunit
LTGGPGTGKTTTVRALVHAQEILGRRALLAAPTGRAAKRLSEATGREARTVHRLLEWNPATADFRRDESSPLDAELILVDEASMLDVRLAESLFSAVPNGATLVLVGDVDQLPPVGPGQVLRELIRSSIAHTVRLETVFRQAQRSAIVRGAHEILHGHTPQPTPTGTRSDGDLFIVRTRDPDAIADRVVKALSRMKRVYGLDPKRDVMVLSPMRRGSTGTERLNALLQGELNPAREPSKSSMRVGDKVMQLRNDYDRDVYNGDLGEIRRMEGGITYVDIDGREVQYKVEQLDDLSLAYASTIHKVQGSEFPAIVVVLHAGHHVLLSRALVYTAVTRAKRLVMIIGDDRALHRAVKNAETYSSRSNLAERLCRAAETVSPAP